MGTRTEYAEFNVQLTKDEVQKLASYNDTVYDSFDDTVLDRIKEALTPVSAILSIISVGVSATALAVAGAIVSVVSAIDISEKSLIKTVITNGEESLRDINDDMLDGGWTHVEMHIPWLEFVDEGIRVVQGNCYVTKYKQNGTWHEHNQNY